MRESIIGRRYAEAIYDYSEQNDILKEVYDALAFLMENYKNDKEFNNFLNHPSISKEEKKNLLEKIYINNEKVKNIILYLFEKNRIENIKDIVTEFLKIYYEKNMILDVSGIFTKEISEEQKNKLIKNLETKMGKKINLKIEVDPTIIGGGILKIGDRIIDGTIKTQLQSLIKKR